MLSPSFFSYWTVICYQCYSACIEYNDDLRKEFESYRFFSGEVELDGWKCDMPDSLVYQSQRFQQDFKIHGICECCHRATLTTKLTSFKKGYMDKVPNSFVYKLQQNES
jgi:hypothetical protein